MPQFRVSINVRSPKGLPDGMKRTLQADGFVFRSNQEWDRAATWAADERPEPGRRYVYLVDAEDEAHAEARARKTVGSDVRIRVAPYGQ